MCAVITPTPPRERQPGMYGTGRVCMAEGCKTQLSSFNPSETCSLHGGWRMGRVRETTIHDDLRELIEGP